MRRFFCVAAFLAAAPAPARAAFADLGAGARAPGMGDAFVPVADDVYAIYYNPAGLGLLKSPELGASYALLAPGLQDNSALGTSFIGYAQPLAQGRNGTLATAWNSLELGGLYREDSLYLSYGRRGLDLGENGELYAGASLKYLRSGFGSFPEAGSAVPVGGVVGTGQSDPALSGSHSQSAIDSDAGLLYRSGGRFSAGLDVLHANSPNVAFAGTERLPPAVKLGVDWRGPNSNLLAEYDQQQEAAGGPGQTFTTAAELWFPNLFIDDFGLRGGLSVGDNAYKQLSAGLSLRMGRMSVDYAILLPLGGIATSILSHRVALTFRFDFKNDSEDEGMAARPQGERAASAAADYGHESNTLDDPRLVDVLSLIEERRYRLAEKALVGIAAKQPRIPGLAQLSNRLTLVVAHYDELPEPKDAFDRARADALHHFLYGQDRLAVLKASYAFSMKPEDARLEKLLDDMEKAVGVKATRLSPDSPRGFIDELLYRVESANTRGEMGRVETLLGDTLALEPENPTALERLGSLRYLNGRLREAIAAWELAAKIETKESELEALNALLSAARKRVGVMPGDAMAPAAAPVEVPAVSSAASVGAGDARVIENLYQKGMEHYAAGEYLEAQAMFLRILQIDPQNERALKALERSGSRGPGQ